MFCSSSSYAAAVISSLLLLVYGHVSRVSYILKPIVKIERKNKEEVKDDSDINNGLTVNIVFTCIHVHTHTQSF